MSKTPTGVGLGLRWEFIDDFLAENPPVDFVEISPENYMGRGGYYDGLLDRVVAAQPVLSHGLSMSLGGFDPLGDEFLAGLRDFLARVKAPWHSDHLCFGSADGVALHDLLPLTFTDKMVTHVADRIKRAEDAIGVPMAVENISFYMRPGRAEMNEAEFIARVCDKADARLMLDVNNAYVNSVNFGFDVDAWMRTVPLDRVVQIHIAGHDWWEENGEKLIVDTHGADVIDPVLALLGRVLPRVGPVPVLLERDQAIPSLPDLLKEVERIRVVYNKALPDGRAPKSVGAAGAKGRAEAGV
jgi:uncharacterized protein (UPF0276 family)